MTHTGQLFFNDTFLDAFYADSNVVATGYSYQGTRITLANDNIYQSANYGIMDVSYVNAGAGYVGGIVAAITVGVNSTTVQSSESSSYSASSGGPQTTNGPPSTSSTATTGSTSTSSTSAVDESTTTATESEASETLVSYLVAGVALLFSL